MAYKYYASEYQRKTIRNLRDTIEGELNRIAVTDDIKEIDSMLKYVQKNIEKYAQYNKDRVQGVDNCERIQGIDIKF